MSWVSFGQLAALLLLIYFLINTTVSYCLDKRREDAIKRKEAGL